MSEFQALVLRDLGDGKAIETAESCGTGAHIEVVRDKPRAHDEKSRFPSSQSRAGLSQKGAPQNASEYAD